MLKKKKRRKLRLFVIFIFLLIFGLSVLSGLWSLEAIGSDRCCVSSTCVKTPRLVSGRIGSNTWLIWPCDRDRPYLHQSMNWLEIMIAGHVGKWKFTLNIVLFPGLCIECLYCPSVRKFLRSTVFPTEQVNKAQVVYTYVMSSWIAPLRDFSEVLLAVQ